MKIFELYVNGKAYQGESEETVPCDYGGKGFHTSNHREVSVLLFGDEPEDIWGTRGLNSALERIMLRMDYGLIKADEITIKVRDE